MSDTKAPTDVQKENLSKEIAGIDRSFSDLLFYGGGATLLMNGDEVIRARGKSKGIAIYADLERDAHVASVVGKRKRAVTAREWDVTPASDSSQDALVAEVVKATLKQLRFDKLTKATLDAVLKGFCAVELIWKVRTAKSLGVAGGQYVIPVKFKKRDQRRFIFDIEDNPRLLTKAQPMEGELLPERKFIIHTVGEADESPYGRGVGHAIFWPVFFKRQNISFWLTFAEKFGSPTAKGMYPSGASSAEQTKLLNTLQSVSRNAGVIFPEGMEIELLEAARSGGDGYERMCAYMDSEISKAVLGETLTTTVGNTGGNRALGDVHNEVRTELAKDDADELSYTFNETLVRWIVDLNFPGCEPPNVWRNFDEQEDVDKTAERDGKLKALGWERNEESFTETYGPGYVRVQQEPEPGSGLRLGTKGNGPLLSQAALRFSEKKEGLFARLVRFLSFADSDPVAAQRTQNKEVQDTIAAGSELLARDWEKLIGPRVQELQTLLDETGDLVLFRERLSEILTEAANDEFTESLARATFAASLAGRLPRK